jgi:hypothetical protein
MIFCTHFPVAGLESDGFAGELSAGECLFSRFAGLKSEGFDDDPLFESCSPSTLLPLGNKLETFGRKTTIANITTMQPQISNLCPNVSRL